MSGRGVVLLTFQHHNEPAHWNSYLCVAKVGFRCPAIAACLLDPWYGQHCDYRHTPSGVIDSEMLLFTVTFTTGLERGSLILVPLYVMTTNVAAQRLRTDQYGSYRSVNRDTALHSKHCAVLRSYCAVVVPPPNTVRYRTDTTRRFGVDSEFVSQSGTPSVRIPRRILVSYNSTVVLSLYSFGSQGSPSVKKIFNESIPLRRTTDDH